MPSDVFTELRKLSEAMDWENLKLVVTVLDGSSIQGQLPVLERYPMKLEVCTLSYSRDWGWQGSRTDPSVRGSLTASWADDDAPGDRYHDVNL